MVNINTVYNAVLVITNKDNRGYITPEEFNSLAIQAQEAIFASYFMREMTYEMQTGGSNVESDFSNPKLTVAQKISAFYKEGTLTKAGILFPYPADFYKLGIVSVDGISADHSSHGEIKYLTQSPLTHPVAKQPIYTLLKTGVRVYPDSVTTGVAIDYLSKPLKPKWGYLLNGTIPIYDPTVFDPATDSYDTNAKSLNFELDPSEQVELIIRILTYAGVVIKQADVAQFALGREQELTTTEQ